MIRSLVADVMTPDYPSLERIEFRTEQSISQYRSGCQSRPF